MAELEKKYLINNKKTKVFTIDKGPSSMLQPNHGFQLGCGGDHDITPPGDW